MKLFASSWRRGLDQTNCRSSNPLSHVQPHGCPFIAQRRIGMSFSWASSHPSPSVSRQPIRRQVNSLCLGRMYEYQVSNVSSVSSCAASDDEASSAAATRGMRVISATPCDIQAVQLDPTRITRNDLSGQNQVPLEDGRRCLQPRQVCVADGSERLRNGLM